MSSKRNNQEILFEARFILPETTPDGHFLEGVHEDLEADLLESFGGFNSSMVESYKIDKEGGDVLVHDDAVAYEVVIPNASLHTDKLKDIALKYASKMKQEFVYFRQPNGEVYFLDVE